MNTSEVNTLIKELGKKPLGSAVVTGKYACNVQYSQDRFSTS